VLFAALRCGQLDFHRHTRPAATFRELQISIGLSHVFLRMLHRLIKQSIDYEVHSLIRAALGLGSAKNLKLVQPGFEVAQATQKSGNGEIERAAWRECFSSKKRHENLGKPS
jgi:hypothetical protein